MNKDQAKLIVETHDIGQTMEDAEESEMLRDNNPELFEAYQALIELAK